MKTSITVTMMVLVASSALYLAFNAGVMWLALFAGLGLLYGSASYLVAALRLHYLAAVSPHASLAAATLALAITGGPLLLPLTLVIGGGAIAAAAAASRGFDSPRETAASVLVAASVVVALLAMEAAAGRGVAVPVSALVAGDPLLATGEHAFASLVLGACAALFTYTTARLHAYIGADAEDAVMAWGSLRVRLLSWIGIAVLAIASAGMLWITGFILQHVLLLVPALAAGLSNSAKEGVSISLTLALASSLSGAALAFLLDMPPSGLIGLSGLILLLMQWFYKRVGNGFNKGFEWGVRKIALLRLQKLVCPRALRVYDLKDKSP